MSLRSSTNLNDKNLRERLEEHEQYLQQRLQCTEQLSTENAREQLLLLDQLKHTLGDHTRRLEAQNNTTTRLAERMYYRRPKLEIDTNIT
jgi:adenosyl cobinamide kinase/adenosyl cobinamide phosphate guanylyltransferase